ncbi:MAG: alpha-E domain-containing protein [Verrucomicrobiota bacterium]
MLSRNADSLLWMSRYVERAENIARIVDVNLQMLLDYQRLDDYQLEQHWEPLVLSLGEEELFAELYENANSASVTEFLTFDERNPNSILNCMDAARENARSIRDQISDEMWEEINRLYLFMHTSEGREVWEKTPTAFYKEMKQCSYLFQGLINATLVHDEGRDFTQVGRFMERADKTTRLLDVKYHILLPEGDEVGGTIDSVQWAAILRCCSAFEGYQDRYGFDIKPWQVAEYLIFAESFPRSIRFCLRTLDTSLRRISKSPVGHFSNEAEKLTGRLLSEINYSTIDDIYQIGLHQYLDTLQLQLNEIGEKFYESYNAVPASELEEEIELQLTQQQQMQQ